MYATIFLTLFLLAAFWGWHKGALTIALRLTVLLLSYALAWQETPTLANWLVTEQLMNNTVLAWPAAGIALLVGGGLAFGLCAAGIKYLAPEEWKEGGKKSGALLGATLGAALAVLVVWAAGALQDAWQLRQQQDADNAPASTPSPLSALDQQLKQASGEAMAQLAEASLGDSPATPLATQWLREPVSIGTQLQHLASKPELRELFQDANNYAVISQGSVPDIMSLPTFGSLVEDPAVMQLLQAGGLPGSTDTERASALATLLARYTRNFEKLRSNAEFQSLLSDPTLKEKLKQDQPLALLTDSKIRRLAELLSDASSGAGELPNRKNLHGDNIAAEHSLEVDSLSADTSSDDDAVHKPLYRWRDSNGRLHITEQKPVDGVAFDVIQHR